MSKNLCTKVKDQVTQFDLFSYSQFIRYGAASQYRSVSGGCCSLVIMIGFTIIFVLKLIETINKTNIISTTTIYEEKEPSAFNITSQKFLFAIGISTGNQHVHNSLDLADPNFKFFDIELIQQIYNKNSSRGYKQVTYSLVPCSREAWISAYPDIGDTFDRLQLKQWLCLSPNTTLTIQGKHSSNIFKTAKITVKECEQIDGDNRKCSIEGFIDYLTYNCPLIRFHYYFMNTLINANDKEYMGSYLQDGNYFSFSNSIGSVANIFVSSYNIQSDMSLLPTTDIVEDFGSIVYEQTRNYAQQAGSPSANPYFIQIYLKKSSLSIKVTRSFQKYSDFLSYIGGLFGSIISAFFIMTSFNGSAFQIEAASKMYKSTKDEIIKSDHFNILTYIAYAFYSIIQFFGANPYWKLFRQFDSARKQISKQLDINLIIKKIGFLQNCMGYLFQDFQLKCLYLKDKLTLDGAAKNRRKFSSRQFLLKLKKKRKKQEQKNRDPVNQEIHASKTNNQLNSLQQIMEKRRGQLGPHKQYLDQSPPNTLEQRKQYPKGIVMQLKEQERQRQVMTRFQGLPNDRYKRQYAHEIEDSSSNQEDLLSLDEDQQKQMYQDVLSSLRNLYNEASKGEPRCVEIFNNLDEIFEDIAGIPLQLHNREQTSLLSVS